LIRLALSLLLAVAALNLPGPALAQVDAFEFETEEQQQRFRRLSNELRCPMCQNTNLTGSTGGVAEDLRREIHRMIIEGLTDQEIEQFMFERYGDFIFYRPRLRAETVLLWFGPLIFLVVGGVVISSIIRKSKAVPEESLSDEEQRQLDELLDK
jgi:cytochrome c-type biogenesis protein CcmH